MSLYMLLLLLLSWNNQLCHGSECSNVDEPLITHLDAPMKAHLDISTLSSQIKTLIEKSVEKEVKTAMWSNMAQYDATMRLMLQNSTESINRPAFLATLSHDLTPPLNSVIKFDHVITNIGGHYSPSTGIFSVPKDGLYMFSATTRSSAYNINKYLHCELMVDSTVILKMFGQGYGTGTGNAVLNLKKGARVFVRKDNVHKNGENMLGRHWSMFSGYFIA